MILDIDENTDVADTNDTNNTNNKDFILMKEEYLSLLDDICSIKSVLYYKKSIFKNSKQNTKSVLGAIGKKSSQNENSVNNTNIGGYWKVYCSM